MENKIEFLKLRNGEDLVATVLSSDDQSITIKRPVCVMIENVFDEGRQLINVREWLPPLIVSSDTITLDIKEILARMDTSADFIPQYKEICEMFFDDPPVMKKKSVKKDAKNIISLVEALAEKKDKPLH